MKRTSKHLRPTCARFTESRIASRGMSVLSVRYVLLGSALMKVANKFFASAAIGASLLLCNIRLWGQESPCLRRTVLANVVTEAGWPVQDLSSSDFSAEFRGKPIRIPSVTRNTTTPRIVIVLDASGSMTSGFPNWEIPRQMAVDAVRKAPATSPVALIIFSSHVVLRIDFTKGRSIVMEQIITVQPGKNILTKGERTTALWDAVLDALELLQPTVPGDVIYAITDGADNASHIRRREIERRLIASGVRPFIAFPPVPPLWPRRYRTPDELNAATEISEFMEVTGGIAINLDVPIAPQELHLAQDTLLN